MAASNINKHACSASVGLLNDKCPFCERKGLPILPVRYAVCERSDFNKSIPELDESRIAEFTDIYLDKEVKNGNQNLRKVSDSLKRLIPDSTKNQVNKYILRRMRPGYIYFFDEHNPDGMLWYAYLITSDSKFYQFKVAEPVFLDQISFPENCNNPVHSPGSASLITIPNPDKSRTLYYAYTEQPWAKSHLKMIKKNSAWREKNMQKIDIGGWINNKDNDKTQPYAFSTKELNKIAEISGDVNNIFSPIDPYYSRRNGQEEREDLLKAFNSSLKLAPEKFQGKGLILAVKDEVGIIDELNSHRLQASATLSPYLEDEDRRRRLLCKQAIDLFKKNYKQASINNWINDNSDDIDDENEKWAPIEEQYLGILNYYKIQGDKERFTKKLNEYKKKKEDHDNRIEEIRNTLLEEAKKSDDVNDSTKDHAEQLDSLYDKTALDSFYQRYINNVNDYKEYSYAHDSDYSLWVDKHLKDVLNRYSEKDYWVGMAVGATVANALRGGIQSDASKWMWEKLASDIGSVDSVLLKGLFNNYKTLIDKSFSNVNSLELGETLKVNTIKDWEKTVKEIQDNSESLFFTGKPSSFRIINTLRPTQGMLASIIGKCFSTLAAYEKSGLIEKDMITPLRKLLQYEVLVYCTDPDVINGKRGYPKLFKEDLKLSDYLEWIKGAYGVSESELDSNNKINVRNNKVVSNRYSPASSDEETANFMLLDFVSLDGSSDLSASDEIKKRDSRSSDLLSNMTNVAATFTNGLGQMNITSGAGTGWAKSIGSILMAVNLVDTAFDKGFKEENKLSFAKILGFTASAGSFVQNSVESYQTISYIKRGASLENSIINSARWKAVSSGLQVVSTGLSFYDSLQKLSDAFQAKSQGRELAAYNLEVMSAVTLGVAFASIAASAFTSSLEGTAFGPVGTIVGAIVGVILGLVTLAFSFWFATLVAPAVEQWISRSLIGRHGGVISPFKDTSSEQNALQMVMQGVYVEINHSIVVPNTSKCIKNGGMDIDDIDMACMKEEMERAKSLINIYFKIIISNIENIELTVNMSSEKTVFNIINWKYMYKNKKIVEEKLMSKSRRHNKINKIDAPVFVKEEKSYKLEFSHDFLKEDIGKYLSLNLSLQKKSVNNYFYKEAFLMEL